MNVITTSKEDRHKYVGVKTFSPNLKEVENEGVEKNPLFPRLLEDTFQSFYQYDPELQQKVDPSVEPHREFLNQIMQTKEYRRLHEMTARDEFMSAMSAMRFAPNFISDVPEEEQEKQKDNWGKSMLNGVQDEDGEPGEGFAEYGIDWDQIRQNAREHLKEVEAEVGELKQCMAACGSLHYDCPLEQLPFEQAQELVQQIRGNPKFKTVLELAGRLKTVAINKRRHRSDKARTEITGVTVGDDVCRQLPNELFAMTHPVLNRDWTRRFTERSISQYDLIGTDKQGRGPIVVCIDESGSMGYPPAKYTPEVYAKSILYPLGMTCLDEKRDLAVVLFTGIVEAHYSQVQNNPELLKQICMNFYCGSSTKFDPPMAQALEYVESARYADADILFITDGLSAFSPEMIKRVKKAKEEKGLSIYAAIIGTGAGQFSQIADAVWDYFDINDDDSFTDKMFKL